MKKVPFHEAFRYLVQHTHAHHKEHTLWAHVTLWSMLIFVACIAYITFAAHWQDITTINQALAQTGFILIGFSMMMSSVCYFWDFADHMIIYRKHLGLVGFWYAMLHGLLSLMLAQFDFTFFLLPENIVSFTAAIIATLILMMMALISNHYAIHQLGGKNWRRLLRTGYLVIIFGMMHMVLKAWPQWDLWLTDAQVLPPLSFLTALFLTIIIFMRLLLWYVLAHKR